jgi:copper chaperone CopZ
MNKKSTIQIEGMTCMSCLNSVQTALYGVDGVKQVTIDLDSGKGELVLDDQIELTQLHDAVASAGTYILTIGEEADQAMTASIRQESYKPLILVVLYLLGITLAVEWGSGMFLWETWMPNFMAGFFLIFSFFKLLDLKGFASSYAHYDLIAAKSKIYAFAYPFIELGLGLAYLLFADWQSLHLITAVVMFISLLGVVRGVINKQKIQCACLGTVFNLPMSTVTIIEDGVMVIMALLMYLK